LLLVAILIVTFLTGKRADAGFAGGAQAVGTPA
jgi:hypothetical protein